MPQERAPTAPIDIFADARITQITPAVAAKKHELIAFAAEMIRLPSVTGAEGPVAERIQEEMRRLDYDEVWIDRLGNVVGRIGNGPCVLFMDSHMDTVDVIDAQAWKQDPYGGNVVEGKLYGRGAVDMKGPLAAAVYAGAIAKQLGLLEGKTLYISASVMEEDYDGQAVRCLLEEHHISPDAVVICEATELQIGCGHRGRALIEVTVYGKSCHGSRPELGVNPVYSLERVIRRINQLSQNLPGGPEGGSVAITGISCVTASANSVPQSASLVLDRRLSIREDYSYLCQEMDALLDGEDGQWKICDIPGITWRQEPITLHSFLPAWEINESNSLVRAARKSCRDILGCETKSVKLGYSTNAVITAGTLHIPTIVLGPGSTACAHMKDEFCPVEQMLQACGIYAALCQNLGSAHE